MIRKIVAPVALTAGLLLVGAPAQAATMPNVVGMNEQSAYDFLDKNHVKYTVLVRELSGSECYVSSQSTIEPDLIAWLRGLVGGSLGSVSAPERLGLIISCV